MIVKHRKSKHSVEYNRIAGDVDKCREKIRPIGLDINIDSLDLGNKKFHQRILNQSKNNNLIVKNEKKIKRLQRKQSRRIEVLKKTKSPAGSNFYQTQQKINKLYAKNNNKKNFNLHALTNQILKEIKDRKLNCLIVEDLNVKEMTSKKKVRQ